MEDQFRGYMKNTHKDYKKLWDESIIVIDTNILLYFYKYPSKQTASQLLEILRKLNSQKRLWVPHQVALEYFFNYEKNMDNQEEGYLKVKRELAYLIKETKDKANKLIQNVIDDNPFIDAKDFKFFTDNLESSNELLNDKITEEINDLPNSEEIHLSILSLLKNNIGEPYDQKDIDKIEDTGRERYELKLPPGFKDKKDKKENRSYGGIRYHQAYGDLIVWNQIIDKVKELESPKPIIFITEESDEDWWHIVKGKTKGPHPNLIQEFFDETNQDFHMYKTERFIEYARKYLGFEIDDTQLNEVSAELESIRTAEERKKLNKEKIKSEHFSILKKNQHEANYRALLDNAKISIKEILDFLSINEKEQGIELIKTALHDKGIGYSYNEVISEIIERAMPYMEDKFKDLNTDIALDGNAETANDYSREYQLLPDDIVERGVSLLQLINRMEIFYLDELPF